VSNFEGTLRSPAPAGATQDGSAVAEEPQFAPAADRRPRRRFLADGTTLPRRLSRRRAEAGASLQVARPQDGVAAARAIDPGVLLGPPTTQHQRGRQGHL